MVKLGASSELQLSPASGRAISARGRVQCATAALSVRSSLDHASRSDTPGALSAPDVQRVGRETLPEACVRPLPVVKRFDGNGWTLGEAVLYASDGTSSGGDYELAESASDRPQCCTSRLCVGLR